MNTITKPTVFIATPMYGGMCTGTYAAGMMQMIGAAHRGGFNMYYSYMLNESLITRARNNLAYDFLQSDATHLLFIDADIGFNPDDVASMLKANVEVICGLYPKKEIHWPQVADAVKRGVEPAQLQEYTGSFVVNTLGGGAMETGISNTVEIEHGGTGFMLIKREVFEGLIGKVPTYTNDMYHAVDEERKVKVINEFFATSIDEESNRLLSEDYHFCKIARQNGVKIYGAPWVRLSHTGTYVFNGRLLTTEEVGK